MLTKDGPAPEKAVIPYFTKSKGNSFINKYLLFNEHPRLLTDS
jgi:hypothetical protein